MIDYCTVVFCTQLANVRNLMLMLMDLNKQIERKGGNVYNSHNRSQIYTHTQNKSGAIDLKQLYKKTREG